MKLQIKKLLHDIEAIGYVKDGDAAVDLRASGVWVVDLETTKATITRESYTLQPQERILIKTGISVAIPQGHWGNIRDRSGHAFKHGLSALAGVIDETFRGEIGVVMVNTSKTPYTISKNERIAQMIITPYTKCEVEYVDNLSETNRGETSFGDSGYQ